MRTFVITTWAGERRWQADTARHAVEQHLDAHPDETIDDVQAARQEEPTMKVQIAVDLNDGLGDAPSFETTGTIEDIGFVVADELVNDEGRPLIGATVTVKVLA